MIQPTFSKIAKKPIFATDLIFDLKAQHRSRGSHPEIKKLLLKTLCSSRENTYIGISFSASHKTVMQLSQLFIKKFTKFSLVQLLL